MSTTGRIIEVYQTPDADFDYKDATFEAVSQIALQELNLDRLIKGVSIFIFRKKDGSLRKAIGTLNENTIPRIRTDEAKKAHTPSPNNQTFFDLQSLEFRSYNVEALIAVIKF